MSQRYHINEKGNPGVCRAKIKCRFGDLASDHYPTRETAQKAYELKMNAASQQGITQEYFDALPFEKRVLIAASFGIALFRGSEQDYWRALYDTTPAGELWLERKKKENKGRNSEWKERTALRDKMRSQLTEENFSFTVPEYPGNVLAKGFSGQEDEHHPAKNTLARERLQLAHLSARWIEQLSADEIEAVSWMTSNGSSVVNKHLSGVMEDPKGDYIWGYDVYSREHLNSTIAHFKSAMEKAPRLEEPVVIYRGTKQKNLGWSQLDRPASSTASLSVAKSFMGLDRDESVLLEIKTNRIASPVGMSAWGGSELEVLAPLGEYQKMGDFRANRGRKDEGGNDCPLEDWDNIRIVQLEHQP